MNDLKAKFVNMCPNCGGTISDERLELKLPCKQCLPEVPEKIVQMLKNEETFFAGVSEVRRLLKERDALKNYEEFYRLEKEVEDANKLFYKATGNKLWSAQKTWLRRVISNRSFAVLAPTGVGKTLFGTFTAVYLAKKEKENKSIIILPTSLLVKQVYERAKQMAENLGLDPERTIIAYLGRLTGKKREEVFNRIRDGDFNVLIVTSQFLRRNFKIIWNEGANKYSFVFVDDVDAILRSSKNIDQVLMLLGLPQDAVADALKLIYLKRRIAGYYARRQQVPEELYSELNELKDKLEKILKGKLKGCLVISTATGKPRGARVKLFRELLGFEIGARTEALRNVVDSYILPGSEDIDDEVVKLIKTLGKGGLVFVPVSKGLEYAQALNEKLRQAGIRSEVVHAKKKSALDRFVSGEVDVLVGVAVYYGLLVRGLDLPHIVKYAVFAGVPHFKFSLNLEEAGPFRLLQFAFNIRPALEGYEQSQLDRLVGKIRRVIYDLDAASVQILTEALKEGKELEGRLEYVRKNLVKLKHLLIQELSKKDVVKRLEEKTMLVIRTEEGQQYIYVPDTMTYLQASGRTSRLYAGGLSKGLSVVVVDDEGLFNKLVRQSRWYSDEIEWVNFNDLDVEKLMKEINKEREFIAKLIRGEIKPAEVEDLVKTALVIVESPTKARTIASFFGKPSRRSYGVLNVYETSTGRYVILTVATKGHIIDLSESGGFYGVEVSDGVFIPVYKTLKRCLRCGEQFTDEHDECPVCGSKEIFDQGQTIESLRELAREVDLIFLATDPDTEGEKIAWDTFNVLSPYVKSLRRIEFHEVTRKAIENAIKSPRSVFLPLVEAQIVRRIADRWIGFSLSKKLWDAFNLKFLSAGRVQTPVLGWIIQRYEEARKGYRVIFTIVLDDGKTIRLEVEGPLKKRPSKIKKEIAENGVEIEYLGEEEETVSPPPPFTTDTMLREASRNLRTGVAEVMKLAQDLFELGLITYHRTDSTRVSDVGIKVAREYITENFGKEYFEGRVWGAGGAHECIRPTRPIDAETLLELIRQGIFQPATPLTRNHIRLYDLIFRRFMASQMKPAKIVKTQIRVKALTEDEPIVREFPWIKTATEEGFLKVYRIFAMTEPPSPGLHKVKEISHRRFPLLPLYTQADIIKLMKERGIGRPSTYAKILDTLLKRKYVIESGGKLVPTKLGKKVYEYLSQNYKDLVVEERTRYLEEKMDKVERGEENYLDVLKEFYQEIKKIEGGS